MWIVDHSLILMILTFAFGLIMAGAVGANDVANAMGTSVGARVLTIKQAVIIAGVFESLGALLASGQVSQTLSSGLIDVHQFAANSSILVVGMISSLAAAATWLLLATKFGWPVSTTHSIVGAIIGFSAFCLGMDKVNWSAVVNITLGWLITPFVSGLVAYLLFYWVQKTILSVSKPNKAAIKHLPVHIFIVSVVLIWVTLSQGIKPLGLDLSYNFVLCLSVAIGLFVAYLGKLWLKNIVKKSSKAELSVVERSFGVLAVFTACAMAFAHGSNDTANAIGPMNTVFNLIANKGQILTDTKLPFWLVFFGAFGVCLGLGLYGYKVIATVGTKITDLTPSRGFAAQFATALTVVVCSGFGAPVSTTQILIGSLLGVGLARGIGAINLHVIRDIIVSWIVTLPAGALLAIFFYKLLITLLPKIV